MRPVAAFLAMTLTGTLAFADEAKAPEPQPEPPRSKVALRVVKILPESHQALLYDRQRGTHVLANVGSSIGGYTVEGIDEDEVTLTANGKEVVLAGPDLGLRPSRPLPAPAPAKPLVTPEDPYASRELPADPYATTDAPADPYPATGSELPADPYSAPPAASGLLGDPYAEPEVRTVKAPAPPPAPPADATPPIVTVSVPAPAPAPAPAKPAAADTGAAFASLLTGDDAPAPSTPATTAPVAPAATGTQTMIARTELDAALADFGGLTRSLRGSFSASGAKVDHVAPSSVFAKAGLRAGDVVTSVDGRPLRSIDDAADLYVRAQSTRASVVQILRANKPITLKVQIQ